MAAKKPIPKKSAPTKAAARASGPKKAIPQKNASKTHLERGEALLGALRALLDGPATPIGEPRPLDAVAVRAFEDAAGVAMSPSLHALLSFDAGHMQREYQWFDEKGRFLAKPLIEVIADHAGPFTEMYAPLCETRFPGKAIALDQGSDSMRILYFGDPDELGEYPVLFVDHDDVPILGVDHAGFDGYVAAMFGLEVPGGDKAAKLRAKTLLGTECWDGMAGDEGLPTPTSGPLPGSVLHPTTPSASASGSAKPKARRLTDAQLDKALHERAGDGDTSRVQELLTQVKERERPRATLDLALMAASGDGNVAMIQLLLSAGASPRARDSYGCALARLVHHENALELARVLIEAGADPNGPSVNGQTAVHEAVAHGSTDLLRLYLEAGGDPNRPASNGRAPLHVGRHPNRTVPPVEMVDLMVAHGGDPNVGKRLRPLHAALEDGLIEHARRLLAHGADPNVRAEYQETTALHIAFERGIDAIVPDLLAAGADRKLKDSRGVSFEAIYGPRGEDIRPITVHYVTSVEPQIVTIDVRFAVLNPAHMEQANLGLSPREWTIMAEKGLAGGSAFRPGTSKIEVKEDTPFKSGKKAGFLDRKYVLEVSSVAPEFLVVIGRPLFGGAVAYTGAGILHTLRAVSLSIVGERGGESELEAETLRNGLTTGAFAPTEFPEELPFELEVRTGRPTSISIESSQNAVGNAHEYLQTWLSTQTMWRRRENAAAVLGLMVMPGRRPGTFDLSGFDLQTQRSSRSFPFLLEGPLALLRNTLRALHDRTPIRKAIIEIQQ